MQLNIGAHMSIAGGYAAAAKASLSIGADTFQFFTRNPRGGQAKELNEADIAELREILAQHSFAPLLAHSPYTINMASGKEETRGFAEELLISDFQLMAKLPATLYNIHPGSHVGIGEQAGIENILKTIEAASEYIGECTLLLETMSGKGTEIGVSFEQISQIIDRSGLKDKIGVCIDTCHVFCAGYDIVNDLDGVMTLFDKTIGLSKLKAAHINDSMNPFASHKDRHAPIGLGEIGKEAIIRFVNHEAIRSLPMLLETPHKELNEYAEEIALLKDSFK